MQIKSDTRRQVEAEIIKAIAEAEARGIEGVGAARRAFPGVPDSVLYELWAEFDYQRTEAWWQDLERTIDGEVIKNAVAKVGS
jgi:hypothetical protein